MKQKIKAVLTIGFSLFMFGLYITNNIHLESLAKKIEREMIVPYTQRFSSFEEVRYADYIQEPVPTEFVPVATPDDDTEPVIQGTYSITSPAEITISESELWQALSTYRTTHGKSAIQQSESLCIYARSRAKELYDRLETNPDDPLDGHAGFSRDADSGHVFKVTGYNTVGENLAYTPGYTNATQIIEWGWDTSPGHRSLQLSEDITHGCITGIHPIFIGIFTY
ncbi:CAP domain-containing protein [Candidatus Roizmanbacteria bacterium]|nr:CAP domain-containing protein [Candidatus Roizmanbacteria bacterium]